MADPALSEELRALMTRYQAGQIEAFDRLYARLAPGLRARLVSLSRDPARADDLLQETFLQIHRARHTYDPDRPVEPWAYAIARHVFLMDRRGRSRRREQCHVEAGQAGELQWPSHDAAVTAHDEVRRALATLTPGTRQAVLLHHVGGWSFREVGARLGIRDAAAKLRASRGLASLREWLIYERRTSRR